MGIRDDEGDAFIDSLLVLTYLAAACFDMVIFFIFQLLLASSYVKVDSRFFPFKFISADSRNGIV